MRQKRMNFKKVCANPLCGKPFMSNKDTAKYCNNKCNSKAFQYFKKHGRQAPEMPADSVAGSVRSCDTEKLEYDFEWQRPPGPNQIRKFGEVCDCSENKKIIFLDPVSDHPCEDELWIEEDMIEDLRFGIGVHDLKDRFGNRLYLNQDLKFEFNSTLSFINVALNRIETWFLGRNTNFVDVTYKYKLLPQAADTRHYYERKRVEGLEREKLHLDTQKAMKMQWPHLIYGPELCDQLISDGLLKSFNADTDNFYYGFLTDSEIRSHLKARGLK